ncbi:MAG: asparagine synthase (glutamine-hydrolyzing), partial [Candidatus Sericytochromatia bacterium]|nr:asparagine synthase (glutamine-hydrolyzing) [Candidatus Sericytochromatia bacterium]
MCGIVGVLGRHAGAEQVAAMAAHIAHRGPDGAGTWIDPEAGVALGHRRLAILDLTPGGAQPMASASGRLVIAFNGEIYNFQALREQLAGLGHAFRSTSDTEVLLTGLEQWGLEATLQRLVGMFAFACWDREARALWLARDRAGEKPLYYAWSNGTLLFGSELKALRAHPAFDDALDPDALAAMLRLNHVPAPRTIYRHAAKLPPGTCLVVRPGEAPGAPVPYWSAISAARTARQQPWREGDAAAEEAVAALLGEVVAGQMLADVPLGAFLSGGIDSSLLVALMQAQHHEPVKTFTIGFPDAAYDESAAARAVARHLGTAHTEWIVTPEDALAVILRLPTLYDEPFADSSQLPTHLVAALARRHVTVALSGDGGDEVFGGYNRHVWGPRLWRRLAPWPLGMRRGLARAVRAMPPGVWDGVLGAAGHLVPTLRLRLPGEKVHKATRVLEAPSPDGLHQRLLAHWAAPEAMVCGAGVAPPPEAQDWSGFDLAERFMLLDTLGYLPDDILVKVDRATMAVSLESRAPYLDHRLFELAWRLPPHL